MNTRFVKSLLIVSALAAALSARATVYTVGNGETFVVTGTSGDEKNVRGNIIDAQGGSTLAFEPSQSGGSWFANCWYSIQSTNGVVTLDLSKVAEKGMVSVMGSLFASGDGSFRVIGADGFYMGRGDVTDGFMTLDAAALAFYDADGAETNGDIWFNNQCCVKTLPASSKVAYSFACTAADKYIALAGTNPLGLKSGETYTTPCNIAVFGAETVFPEGTKVKVAAGCTLLVVPAEAPTWREGPANVNNYILPTFRDGVLSADVELAEGSTLILGRKYSVAEAKVTAVAGTVSGAGAVQAGSVGFEALPVSGDVAFSSFPAGLAIASVGSGVARVAPSGGTDGTLLCAQGGAFVLEDVAWRTKVARWYDPSQVSTCANIGRKTGHEGQYDLYYTNDYPLVESVSDCRGVDYPQMLLNNRLIGGSDPTAPELYPDFYPYLVLNGQNGLSYLSCSYYLGSQPTAKYRRVNMGVGSDVSSRTPERRRLFFSNSNGGASLVGITTAKVVMMVFGSQQGGGAAMIGAKNKAFLRGADATHHELTDPVIANDNHVVWIDGERKEKPSETYFSGGWQIVTVDVTGETLYGFGPSGDLNSHQECGGQNYGEILIFDAELTDAERIAAERYLAVKWGLIDQYKASLPRRVDLVGEGAARVDFADTVVLGGQFRGTVTLAGATLSVPDELTPYSEADLPAADRTGWFDPDCRDHVTLYEDIKSSDTPDYVIGLWNRDETPKAEGKPFFTAQQTGGSRRPSYVRAARALGPERGWIDNNHIYPKGLEEQYPGNALRMRPWDGNWGGSSPDQGLPYQTAFIVMDSQRGGGSQLMDSFGGTGLIKFRQTGIPTTAIWPSGTSANVTGGEARLNAVAVDPAKGFTGKAEVFSYNTINETSVNAVSLGFYNNTDSKTVQNGEIFGEILLYDRVVSGDERTRIEAYLMGKWLGRLPEGCSDLSGVTVAGTGAVTSRTATRLPKFDADFAGTVSVEEPTLEMAYANGIVTGTLLAHKATLDCPAACTIHVDFASRPAKGRYELVSAANVKDVAWQLETSGVVGSRAPELIVDASAAKVYLNVPTKGFLMVFK